MKVSAVPEKHMACDVRAPHSSTLVTTAVATKRASTHVIGVVTSVFASSKVATLEAHHLHKPVTCGFNPFRFESLIERPCW